MRAVVKAAGDSLHPLGFIGTKFDPYRFANRFRLLACLQGLRLNGFTEKTAVGYDSITRVFFACSTFERSAEMPNDPAPYRSLFTHGILTAHPNGPPAANLVNIPQASVISSSTSSEATFNERSTSPKPSPNNRLSSPPPAMLLPISALQHLLYCERQCALIHLEQAWAENRFTAEGRVMHTKAHGDDHETRPGVRITRSLPVSSDTLGLSGICDIVEFHTSGALVPVEYKRGKPKSHRADEVQLCAQAMCLEEMLGSPVDQGFLFYGQRKRRTPIAIDAPLRAITRDTAARMHQLISSATTPIAAYDVRKCNACSLIDLCLPHAMRFKKGTAAWFTNHLNSEAMTTDQ